MALIKCSNCGREISNKATVCPHCGALVVENTSVVICDECGAVLPAGTETCPKCGAPIEKKYELKITRDSNRYFNDEPVHIVLDDGKHEFDLKADEIYTMALLPGNHILSIYKDDKIIKTELIDLYENYYYTFIVKSKKSIEVLSRGPESSYISPGDIGNPNKNYTICPNCGGRMVVQQIVESKKINFLLALILTIITSGVFLLYLLVRKKTITKTVAVCQSCGYTHTIREE